MLITHANNRSSKVEKVSLLRLLLNPYTSKLVRSRHDRHTHTHAQLNSLSTQERTSKSFLSLSLCLLPVLSPSIALDDALSVYSSVSLSSMFKSSVTCTEQADDCRVKRERGGGEHSFIDDNLHLLLLSFVHRNTPCPFLSLSLFLVEQIVVRWKL